MGRGKKQVLDSCTSLTSMLLDTKTLSLCLFTAPRVHTSGGACKGLASCSNEILRSCFPKGATFILQMGKLWDGEIKQQLAASMRWSRNRLEENLRGLLVIAPLLWSPTTASLYKQRLWPPQCFLPCCKMFRHPSQWNRWCLKKRQP